MHIKKVSHSLMDISILFTRFLNSGSTGQASLFFNPYKLPHFLPSSEQWLRTSLTHLRNHKFISPPTMSFTLVVSEFGLINGLEIDDPGPPDRNALFGLCSAFWKAERYVKISECTDFIYKLEFLELGMGRWEDHEFKTSLCYIEHSRTDSNT